MSRVPDHARHNARYEGWKHYNPEEGFVYRFDTHESYTWVRLQLTDIPQRVITDRTG